MFDQFFPQATGIPARNRLQRLAELAAQATSSQPSHTAQPARPSGFAGAGSRVERWLPPALTRSPHRLRLTAIFASLVAVILLAGGSIALLGGGPPPERPPLLPVARDTPAPVVTKAGKVAESSLVVSVVGKVASPGLVTVPSGARVADAVEAAGGAAAGVDLTPLNLARKLTDGEQIYVGIPAPPAAGQDVPGGQAASSVSSASLGTVDLNTATLDQLDALPGVGTVTAKRIVEWRTRHGGFTAVDQLQEVEGIGAAKLARLRDQVTVS